MPETRYLLNLDEVTVIALAAGQCPAWVQDAATGMLRGVVPYLPLEDGDGEAAAFLLRHRARRDAKVSA